MLNGKTAVITGGSRGIGRAIALKMAEAGASVAVLYAGRKEAAVEVCEAARGYDVKAECYQCDVSDYAQATETVKKIISDFDGVDILVNNAGITNDKLVLSMSAEDFERVVDVNLKGAFFMIKQVYSHLAKKRAGSIINIASVSGIMGNPGQANYSSAKAGMIGLTKTVAKELAARNVTCNAIAPGFIETDMTGVLNEKTKEQALSAIPMKRMGGADEVANLAVFLASDLSRYITGEVVKIDGGLCM
jgi:3-oxoacyl-[acyl-carrier protein] reductase